jgi:flagellar biosynthetic protein FliR
MLTLLPFFGESFLPVWIRVLLSAVLCFAFFGLLPKDWLGASADLHAWTLAWTLLKEGLLGAVWGYSAHLIFEAFAMASHLVGYQMGFGTATMFFPGKDVQTSSFSALHGSITVIVFLGFNLHYVFLHGLYMSLLYVPLGGAHWQQGYMHEILRQFSKSFVIALQLAAPMMVALLLATAVLGLMARAVPQLNIFTLSFPVSFFLGIGIYMSMYTWMPSWLREHFESALTVGLQMMHRLGRVP